MHSWKSSRGRSATSTWRTPISWNRTVPTGTAACSLRSSTDGRSIQKDRIRLWKSRSFTQYVPLLAPLMYTHYPQAKPNSHLLSWFIYLFVGPEKTLMVPNRIDPTTCFFLLSESNFRDAWKNWIHPSLVASGIPVSLFLHSSLASAHQPIARWLPQRSWGLVQPAHEALSTRQRAHRITQEESDFLVPGRSSKDVRLDPRAHTHGQTPH